VFREKQGDRAAQRVKADLADTDMPPVTLADILAIATLIVGL
jgi:hypothetical protein